LHYVLIADTFHCSVKYKKPTTTKSAHRNRSEGGDFFIARNGWLKLIDGTSFRGQLISLTREGVHATGAQQMSRGAQKSCSSDEQMSRGVASATDQQQMDRGGELALGEVVFNTGMTGYVETLTDPSYHNQILVFTYPLIGNYGFQLKDVESAKLQVSGIVVSNLELVGNHAKSNLSLLQFATSHNIPIIANVDTRDITKYLRTKGTMKGAIGESDGKLKDFELLPSFSSISSPINYECHRTKKVILVDCGAKDNILQSLLALGLGVRCVPYDYDYTQEDYDGVLISNGPGDPMDYGPTVAIAKQALKNTHPVFGICLGSQIMALAAGARTYKLPFGHRGHNQPCMDLSSKHCVITSQNHGYAIDAASLPAHWRVSFRNLNDGTVEGVEHTSKPFFSVQFHPEAAPGPTDTHYLFEKFKVLL
jgi:carbamoyl-phosphate synthase small subunit